MAKKSYKDRNGTTRVGDALRWLVANGKKVAPELLDIAGNITGIEPLKRLGEKIKSDGQLSEADKEMLLAELEFDMIEMQEVTKRWTSDNAADSFMTKNIRCVEWHYQVLYQVYVFKLKTCWKEGKVLPSSLLSTVAASWRTGAGCWVSDAGGTE